MKHDKPAVGLWYAPCCIEDVMQLESEDEAKELADDIAEDGNWVSFGYYDTREELVAQIEAVDGPQFTGDVSDV